jgi:hypothetical protein
MTSDMKFLEEHFLLTMPDSSSFNFLKLASFSPIESYLSKNSPIELLKSP